MHLLHLRETCRAYGNTPIQTTLREVIRPYKHLCESV